LRFPELVLELDEHAPVVSFRVDHGIEPHAAVSAGVGPQVDFDGVEMAIAVRVELGELQRSVEFILIDQVEIDDDGRPGGPPHDVGVADGSRASDGRKAHLRHVDVDHGSARRRQQQEGGDQGAT